MGSTPRPTRDAPPAPAGDRDEDGKLRPGHTVGEATRFQPGVRTAGVPEPHERVTDEQIRAALRALTLDGVKFLCEVVRGTVQAGVRERVQAVLAALRYTIAEPVAEDSGKGSEALSALVDALRAPAPAPAPAGPTPADPAKPQRVN